MSSPPGFTSSLGASETPVQLRSTSSLIRQVTQGVRLPKVHFKHWGKYKGHHRGHHGGHHRGHHGGSHHKSLRSLPFLQSTPIMSVGIEDGSSGASETPVHLRKTSSLAHQVAQGMRRHKSKSGHVKKDSAKDHNRKLKALLHRANARKS